MDQFLIIFPPDWSSTKYPTAMLSPSGVSIWGDGGYHNCLKVWLRLLEAWYKQRGLEKTASTLNLVVMKTVALDIYTNVPTGAPHLSPQHRAVQPTSHRARFSWVNVGFQCHCKTQFSMGRMLSLQVLCRCKYLRLVQMLISAYAQTTQFHPLYLS